MEVHKNLIIISIIVLVANLILRLLFEMYPLLKEFLVVYDMGGDAFSYLLTISLLIFSVVFINIIPLLILYPKIIKKEKKEQ
tara:strand:+ start:480 stop:725 length:246 start_codon:yes stop_codon:yes gene_type:complete